MSRCSRIFLASCNLAISAAIIFGGCGREDIEITEIPVIESVTPDTAGAGDTVLVAGEGFNSVATENTVAFSPCGFPNLYSSRISIPFASTGDSLWLVVPDGAFTGSIRFERENPLGSADPFEHDLMPISSSSIPFALRMDAGDVAKVFFSGEKYDFSLETGEAEEEFLIILFSNAEPPDSSSRYSYSISPSDPCDIVAAEAGGTDHGIEYSNGTSGSSRRSDVTLHLDKKKRDELAGLLGKKQPVVNDLSGAAPRAPDKGTLRRYDGEYGYGALAPQTRDFRVYADISGSTVDPESFTTVTAVLKYEGDNSLLYVDQETDAGCIEDSETAALGGKFDSSIYTIDRNAFGNESDINNDGKVCILLSPVINRLTEPGSATTEGYIAGLFLPADLIPGITGPQISNGMEIFYSMVPDPSGIYGNVYEKDRALSVIEGVLAHEFAHMIMFNYRLLIYGQGSNADYFAETWLDEGMAHIAEDLNGYDESNIIRANIFLENTGNVTLIHGGDTLDERGAAFLFFRYLGDRYGDGVFGELVQTKMTAVRRIRSITGKIFYEIFSDWSAAMFLHGLGYSNDERFGYTSIDLRAAYFSPLEVRMFEHCAEAIYGDVKAMGPEYVRMKLSPGNALDFSIESTDDADPGRINAIIVRLQ